MKKTLLFALAISFIASCTTSNEVVSNKLFQKRKYQKGWHVNSVKKVDKVKKSDVVEYEEEVVAQTQNTEKENNESVTATMQESKTTKEVAEVVNKESKVVSTETTAKKSNSKDWNEMEATTETRVKSSVIEPTSRMEKSPVSETKLNKESDSNNSSSDDMLILLYILAVLIPFVAVGIVTDWDVTKVLITLLLSILCWIPGVVYAFITIRDYN